jgi:hypothetical protein
MKRIRIGGGQGFWGDSNDGAAAMVRRGSLDYMACDYLAELTMSIMARQRLKNPTAGYAGDFITLLEEIGREAFDKKIRIISNAGGMNVAGCVGAIKKTALAQQMHGCKIAYVLGDDISADVERLLAEGVSFDNMDGAGDFNEIRGRIINANVYFGREPAAECLEMGADIVVTGRSTDSALFLAPLQNEFRWAADDWNNLARGITAGHLLECGGQGSGGNFDYGWRQTPRLDDLGFPIAEISPDELIITKAPDTGGIVCEQSCKEQLLYEMHDPAAYITPDVIADVSKASLTQTGENRVRVEGIRGKKRPDALKLSIGYLAGYKTASMLSFAWPDAYEKARCAADIIVKKMERKKLKAEEMQIDYIGLNALHLGTAPMDEERLRDLNEVVLRVAVRTRTKEEAQKLVPEIAPLQLNGPPGASFFGGRAKVQEVIGLWPALIPRDAVKLRTGIECIP